MSIYAADVQTRTDPRLLINCSTAILKCSNMFTHVLLLAAWTGIIPSVHLRLNLPGNVYQLVAIQGSENKGLKKLQTFSCFIAEFVIISLQM